MPDGTWELTRCDRCEWMFIGARSDAALCNVCGANTLHPRVCRAGGNETTAEAMTALAIYMLPSMGGALTLTDVIEREVSGNDL